MKPIEATPLRADLERYRWLRDRIADQRMQSILVAKITEIENRLAELGLGEALAIAAG